ncbi:putative importin subunit beta-4 [Mycena kentingensis (nom. inval.)]|nr:putative importin subunit beta-4 [Mycena kentingensis (nom. inval.)]
MLGKKYAWVSLWCVLRVSDPDPDPSPTQTLRLTRRSRFLLTAPLMIWDAGYCLMRPRSLPGGDLYWFWKPYELYGMVDYVYGVKAYEDGEGFASAAAILNLLETFANIAYLVGTHLWTFDAAPLVGYTGATATLAKTILYSSQEIFCNGCSTGHNTPLNLFAFWIFPNIMWIIFPSSIMWRLGGDMMDEIRRGREKVLAAIERCGHGGQTVLQEGEFNITRSMKWDLVDAKVDIFGFLSFVPDVAFWQNATNTFHYKRALQSQASWFVISGSDFEVDAHGVGGILGNGQTWWSHFASDPTANNDGRPISLTLFQVARAVIRDFTIVGQPSWCNTVAESQDVVYDGMKCVAANADPAFFGKNIVPNTDGVNTYRSNNISLFNWDITCGDDCLAIKGEQNSTKIIAQNITCRGGNGIAFGSLAQYVDLPEMVEDVLMENLTMLRIDASIQPNMNNGPLTMEHPDAASTADHLRPALRDMLLRLSSTSANNAELQEITEELKGHFTSPDCIPALADVVIDSTVDNATRQLAAVELGKLVVIENGKLWMALCEASRDKLKENLPACFLSVQNNLLRRAISRVLASIASNEFVPYQTAWLEILPFVEKLSTSPLAVEREASLLMMSPVLRGIGQEFADYVPYIFTLLAQSLDDPESIDVRIAAVRVMTVLARYMNDESVYVFSFRELVPGALRVLSQCVERNHCMGVIETFDIVDALMQKETLLINEEMPTLVQTLLACSSSQEVDPDQRIRFIAKIQQLFSVEERVAMLNFNKLGEKLVRGLMSLAAEEFPEEDGTEVGLGTLRIILALKTVTLKLPPYHFLPAMQELILNYSSSANARTRRAAIFGIVFCAQSCPHAIVERDDADMSTSNAMWQVVAAALQDADIGACASRYRQLVEAVAALASVPETQQLACMTLGVVLEAVPAQIETCLAGTMQQLIAILATTADADIKRAAITAIGRVAHACIVTNASLFQPYFQRSVGRLQHYLRFGAPKHEEDSLCSAALDTIGIIAQAVGKDAFRRFLPLVMQHATEAIRTGRSMLCKGGAQVLGHMARVYGEEFAPQLENVVPLLLHICAVMFDSNAEKLLKAFDDLGDEQPIELERDQEQPKALNISLPKLFIDPASDPRVAEEQKGLATLDAIVELFAATGKHFVPWLEICVGRVSELADNSVGPGSLSLRCGTTASLLALVRLFYGLQDAKDWSPGLTGAKPLPSDVLQLCMPIHASVMTAEGACERALMITICTAITKTVRKLGPAYLAPESHFSGIFNMLNGILMQGTNAQGDLHLEEDRCEPASDSSEDETSLIVAAWELCDAVTSAVGPDFAVEFAEFMHHFERYCGFGRVARERSAAFSSLINAITSLKASIKPFIGSLLPLCRAALVDANIGAAGKAALALGLLIEHGDMDAAAEFEQLSKSLLPIFSARSDACTADLIARDRAAGILGLLFVKIPAAVSVERELHLLLGAIPLRHDSSQNKAVLNAILHIFRSDPAALRPYLETLLSVFAHVLSPEIPGQIDEDMRRKLIQQIKKINSEEPDMVEVFGLQAFVE